MNGSFVNLLVQIGVPSAIFSAIAWAFQAYRAKRRLIRNAPEQKIDTSMARMQQAAIMQDGLVDNLRDALQVQTERAEKAEVRERAQAARADSAELRERELQTRLNQAERPRPS